MSFSKGGGGGGGFLRKFFEDARALKGKGATPPLPGIAQPPSDADLEAEPQTSTGANSAKRQQVAKKLRVRKVAAGLGSTGQNSAVAQTKRLLG